MWGINGSLALPDSWELVTIVFTILVTVAMVAVAITFHRNAKQFPSDASGPPTSPFRTTAYRLAVAAMLVAIPVVARVLTLRGQGDAIMPAVAIIVGFHFLGLVSAFRSRIFAWIAVAFCALGVGALFLPVQVGQAGSFELRYAVIGLGCALILWLSAVPITSKMLRQLAQSKRR